jgi:flagellar hook protein FlgE
MMRGMFAAISGLKTHQTMLDVTANDIANVNTIGYKSARTTFADALTQTQRGASGPGGGSGGANAAQIGLGTSLGSIDNLMGTGSFQSTGNPLDIALTGQGFFRVAVSGSTDPANPTPNATATEYTRAGNFTTNSQGYLVTQDGMFVQGDNGTGTAQLIKIPDGSTGVSVGQDGQVSYVDSAGARQTAGYLSLASFANSAGLERSGTNRWSQTANSGAPQVSVPNAQQGFVQGGVIEMSNVDLASSFTTMITAERGFQANSRVISTADEMLQDLVNLKR